MQNFWQNFENSTSSFGRSRKMLQNEYLDVKIGFDTAGNEPSKIGHSPPKQAFLRWCPPVRRTAPSPRPERGLRRPSLPHRRPRPAPTSNAAWLEKRSSQNLEWQCHSKFCEDLIMTSNFRHSFNFDWIPFEQPSPDRGEGGFGSKEANE